jgi:hypothetical protein
MAFTLYSLLFTLYSLLFTLYSLLFTLYSLLFTLYSLLFTLYSFLFTLYSLLFTLYFLLFTFYSLLFTLYSLLFTLYSLLFTLYSLLFPLHSCYIFNPTIVAPPIHLFKIIKIDANVTKFLLQKLAIIKPNLQLCKHNQLNKQTMSKKQNILVNHTPTTKIGATHCVKNTPPVPTI